MNTIIIAKEDLYNGGRCFTKHNEYEVSKQINKQSDLMDVTVTNDQGQPHRIGIWYKSFKIKNK